MLSLFISGLILIVILVTVLWVLSVIIKDASIVDLFWGMGFVILNAYYFLMSGDFYMRKMLLLLLVTAWGLRLFIYLFWRNVGKGEDFRYQEFRRSYGPDRYWWISYFQTFLLQGILIMIVSLPLLGINAVTKSDELTWLDYIGVIIWIVGFVFETGGDIQLARFKSNPENKGKVLDKGMWKYTRHPNYFGDFAIWWSFGIIGIAAGSYWTIIGSVIMTILLIKVSGVSLLEKTLKTDKPEYNEYVRKTSSFIPWFPKK